MLKQSLSPPSGTRDFLPREARRRQLLITRVRAIFERFGFQPIETPAFERLETLLGKYGADGDQLIFRLLHRGEKLSRVLAAAPIHEENLAEFGLRYDLTVPLARIIASYRSELPPGYFKRYQIAPVWRADRPAKGRFREFTQCDIDFIGTTSVIAEVEVLNALNDALMAIGLTDFQVRVNHRDLLFALVNHAGVPNHRSAEAIMILDKLDKIGKEAAMEEFDRQQLLPAKTFARIVDEWHTRQQQYPSLTSFLAASFRDPTSSKDLNSIDLSTVFLTAEEFEKLIQPGTNLRNKIIHDPFLARGLTYYTGLIFEIVIPGFPGSIAAGGRYDNLIGTLAGQSIPAVGGSLGFDRIFALMDERGLFSTDPLHAVDVLLIHFADTVTAALGVTRQLRSAGIAAELYPDPDKPAKQFKTANDRGIPFVLVLGTDEVAANGVTLKQMQTGNQERVSLETAIERIKSEKSH